MYILPNCYITAVIVECGIMNSKLPIFSYHNFSGTVSMPE